MPSRKRNPKLATPPDRRLQRYSRDFLKVATSLLQANSLAEELLQEKGALGQATQFWHGKHTKSWGRGTVGADD